MIIKKSSDDVTEFKAYKFYRRNENEILWCCWSGACQWMPHKLYIFLLILNWFVLIKKTKWFRILNVKKKEINLYKNHQSTQKASPNLVENSSLYLK